LGEKEKVPQHGLLPPEERRRAEGDEEKRRENERNRETFGQRKHEAPPLGEVSLPEERDPGSDRSRG
jgi:hypothetical protein